MAGLVVYHTPVDHCIPDHRYNYLVGHRGCLIVRRGCSCHSLGLPVGRSLDLDCTGKYVRSWLGNMMVSRSVSIDVFQGSLPPIDMERTYTHDDGGEGKGSKNPS